MHPVTPRQAWLSKSLAQHANFLMQGSLRLQPQSLAADSSSRSNLLANAFEWTHFLCVTQVAIFGDLNPPSPVMAALPRGLSARFSF